MPLTIREGYRTVKEDKRIRAETYARYVSGAAVSVITFDTELMKVAESAVCNCKDIFSKHGYGMGLGLGENYYLEIDMRETSKTWVDKWSTVTQQKFAEFVENTYKYSCS